MQFGSEREAIRYLVEQVEDLRGRYFGTRAAVLLMKAVLDKSAPGAGVAMDDAFRTAAADYVQAAVIEDDPAMAALARKMAEELIDLTTSSAAPHPPTFQVISGGRD